MNWRVSFSSVGILTGGVGSRDEESDMSCFNLLVIAFGYCKEQINLLVVQAH